MKAPLVSICIPTYNQTEFLQRTFDSIAIQDFKDFDVLVSDDSTTDAVEALAKRFADKFRMSYFRNPVPLGSPANWNALLDKASGAYIKFMHHDDWFSGPDSLSQFVNAINTPAKPDFVFCDSEILNIEKNQVTFNRAGRVFLKRIVNDPAALFSDNRIGAPSATMFRRTPQRFDESLKWLVDIEFYIAYLRHAKTGYINKPLIVNTSGHPGQVTQASQDRETQLGEYSYLYNKIFGSKLPPLSVSWFFIRLFRSYRVKDLSEVTAVRQAQLNPAWWFHFLINISKIRFWKRKQ